MPRIVARIGAVVACLIGSLAVGGLTAGCAVPQSQDVRGKTDEVKDPVSQRNYYVYLPADYSPNRKHPLIVSVHGMKPFDNAFPQLMTWRKLCDENGWIAIAPQLRSPDLFNQFPFRRIDPLLLGDEAQIVAAVKDASSRFSVDSRNVMLTGWSSGGFLIHYVGTRHPELFSLIAPQGANFHPEIMPASVTDAARRVPVYIYHGVSDLAMVVSDSNAAAAWYRQQGFRSVKTDKAPGGHERHPELAARFFADQVRQASAAPVGTPVVRAEPAPWAPSPGPEPAAAAAPPPPRGPAGASVPAPATVVAPGERVAAVVDRPIVPLTPSPASVVHPADGQAGGTRSPAPSAEATGPAAEVGSAPQVVGPPQPASLATPGGPPEASPPVHVRTTSPRADHAVRPPDRIEPQPVSAEPVVPALKVAAIAGATPTGVLKAPGPILPVGPQGDPLAAAAPAPVQDNRPRPLAAAAEPGGADPLNVRILPSVPEVSAPQTVEFRAEFRGIQGPIVDYRWRLDGVLFETRRFAVLKFSRPGQYDIELTVTDAAGNRHHGRTTMRVSG